MIDKNTEAWDYLFLEMILSYGLEQATFFDSWCSCIYDLDWEGYILNRDLQTVIPLPPKPAGCRERVILSERTFIDIVSAGDEKGRYTFFSYHVADYHPGHPEGEYRTAWRGQIFFTNLKEYLNSRLNQK